MFGQPIDRNFYNYYVAKYAIKYGDTEKKILKRYYKIYFENKGVLHICDFQFQIKKAVLQSQIFKSKANL